MKKPKYKISKSRKKKDKVPIYCSTKRKFGKLKNSLNDLFKKEKLEDKYYTIIDGRSFCLFKIIKKRRFWFNDVEKIFTVFDNQATIYDITWKKILDILQDYLKIHYKKPMIIADFIEEKK